jgi:hypothetical protein
VFSCAVVACRYHVAFPASAARFGKRLASIAPFSSSSSVTRNASKTMRTTGVSRAAWAGAAISANAASVARSVRIAES